MYFDAESKETTEKITTLESQKLQLREEVQKLESKLELLTLQLEVEQRQRDTVAKEVAGLTEKLSLEINDKKVSIDTLTKEKKALEEKIVMLEKKVQQLEKSMEDERSVKQQLEESSIALQRDIGELRQQLEAMKESARKAATQPLVPSGGAVADRQLEIIKKELNETKRELDTLKLQHRAPKSTLSIEVGSATNNKTDTNDVNEIKRLKEEIKNLQKLLENERASKSVSTAVSSNNNMASPSAKSLKSPASQKVDSAPATASDSQMSSAELQALFAEFEELQKQTEKDKMQAEQYRKKAEAAIKAKNNEIEELKRALGATPLPSPSPVSSPSVTVSNRTSSTDLLDDTAGGMTSGGGPGSKQWYQKQIDRLNKEIGGLRKECDELKKSERTLKTASLKIPKSDNEMITELTETVEKLRLEKSNILAQLKVEQTEAQRLQKELDEARAELEIDACLRDGPIFNNSSTSLSILTPDTPAVHAAVSRSVIMATERDSLFRDNKRLREVIEQKNKEIEDVKADIKISEEIRHKASLMSLKDELSQTSAKLHLLEAQLADMQRLPDLVLQLEQDRDKLQREIDALNNKLLEKSKETKDLEFKLDMETNERQLLTNNYDKIKLENQDLSQTNESLKIQLREREIRLSDGGHEMESRRNEIALLTTNMEQIKKELSVALQQNLTDQQKIKELQSTSATMMSGFVSKIELLTQQLKDKSKQTSVLSMTEQDKNNTIDRLNRDLITLQKRLDESDASHKATISNLTSSHSNEIINHVKRISQLELELQKLKAEKTDIDLKYADIQRRLGVATSSVLQKEEEIRVLHAALNNERLSGTSSLQLSTRSKIVAVTHIRYYE